MGTFSRPEKMVAYKNDKCEVWFSGVTAGLHIFLFRSIDPLLKASEEEECKLYTEKSKTVIAWDVLYLTTFLNQDIQNFIFPNQSTMPLSTQLETSKVFKSNGPFFAQFGSKFKHFNSEW